MAIEWTPEQLKNVVEVKPAKDRKIEKSKNGKEQRGETREEIAKRTEVLKLRCVKMYDQGVPIPVICKKLNRSRERVYHYLNEANRIKK